jgi:N-dimethylarginine dimethylaminohydrolase
LLHKPGVEIVDIEDPVESLMLDELDLDKSMEQHDNLAKSFCDFGITVHYVNPDCTPTPNLMFCADLVFMTPEGAILARPASNVRAGEERWIARRLAAIGIPILRTLTGHAIFEGADALWIDDQTVLLGIGLRTNIEAAAQIEEILNHIGITLMTIDLPVGTMHLMGILRLLDSKYALAWPYRFAWKGQKALEERGYQVMYIPDEMEARKSGGFNFVTTGPREVLMASGNPITQEFLERNGVKCHTIAVHELQKAAGGIGCLTAVLARELLK